MSNPRPRPKAMMLTQAAADRIKAIMAAKGTNVVGPASASRRAAAPAWSTPWLGRASRSHSTSVPIQKFLPGFCVRLKGAPAEPFN